MTKSLEKLKIFMELMHPLKGIDSIHLPTLGVKLTKDVMVFVKEHERLKLNIVGKDLQDKPIYGDYVEVVRE
jgi:hypothetical protein